MSRQGHFMNTAVHAVLAVIYFKCFPKHYFALIRKRKALHISCSWIYKPKSPSPKPYSLLYLSVVSNEYHWPHTLWMLVSFSLGNHRSEDEFQEHKWKLHCRKNSSGWYFPPIPFNFCSWWFSLGISTPDPFGWNFNF